MLFVTNTSWTAHTDAQFAVLLQWTQCKVAKSKNGGGGVCRAANGTVPITGFPSLIGRVGVLFSCIVIYAVVLW